MNRTSTILLCLSVCIWHRGELRAASINEIRTDQLSTDNSEYFELTGEAGQSLDNLWYVVLGDGQNAASGAVEAAIDLSGNAIRNDQYFLGVEDSFENGAGEIFEGVSPDWVGTLTFENNDSVTHLLVNGFSGSIGDDLDTNDDGTLDGMPWTAILDAVGLLAEISPPAVGEFAYGQSLGFVDVGPIDANDMLPPAHVFRIPDGDGDWQMGPHEFTQDDTPGGGNRGARVCGDLDSDGDVDSADRTGFSSNWTGALNPGEGNKVFSDGDCDDDGDVDAADLTGLVQNWTGAMQAGNAGDGALADLGYDHGIGGVTIDARAALNGITVPGTEQRTDITQFPFSGQPLIEYLSPAEYAIASPGGTLDSIAIPEPSSLALLMALAGMMQSWWRCRRQRPPFLSSV